MSDLIVIMIDVFFFCYINVVNIFDEWEEFLIINEILLVLFKFDFLLKL